MKKSILSLLAAAVLLPAGITFAATTPQLSFSQGTNVVLTWPSSPGEQFMVLHRQSFHPSRPWKVVATNLPAGPFNLTVFTHVGGVPPYLGPVLNGGGGSGSPPGSPAAATLAAPTTDPSTTTSDQTKVKKKDAGPPALPDEKELEKQYREWLKEWEKQQKNNGGGSPVQTLSATATYSLPDLSYTNFSAGFYVITHTVDDTDGDGLPDWWEAANGLALLVNDATEDPDGDGVPNLAEYAYGTDPTDPNSKPVVYVSYTSPVNTNTYFPTVQITGSINLNIRTLRYDVTNAAGVQTDLEAFVTRRTVIPGSGFTNSPARHTNSFQCFDVPLTNGANTIGLRFTDAYGLTFATTVAFTVDFNASPAAPVGTVFWPANGAQLGADTFTLRGRLDNPTASVVARMTIDDEEQEIGGLVERDGTFWLEDLPTPTSGTVSLVFTDAGGKASTNTLNLSRSPVSLVLNDPSGPNLWDQTMNLNGTVSDPAYSVWINSTRATVDESGNWTAEGVPLNAGGVASFAVRAVPNSDNGGAGTGGQAMAGGGGLGGLYSAPGGNPGSASAVDAAFDFDKPPRIVVSSYTMRSQEDNPTYETGSTNRQTLDWTRSGAGYSGTATSYSEVKYPAPSDVWREWRSTTYPFPGTNGFEFVTGIKTSEEPFSYTNLAGEPGIPYEQVSVAYRSETQALFRKARTHLELESGGKADPEIVSIWELSGSASAHSLDYPLGLSVDPNSVLMLEQPLDSDGIKQRPMQLAAAKIDVTPRFGPVPNQIPFGWEDIRYNAGITKYTIRLFGSMRGGRPWQRLPKLFLAPRNFTLGYDYLWLKSQAVEGTTLPDQLVYRIGPAANLVTNAILGGTPAHLQFWDGKQFSPPPNHIGYVNPTVQNAVQVRMATSRTNAASRVYPMTVLAKAFVGVDQDAAGLATPIAGHAGDITGSLQGMGYNEIASTINVDKSYVTANSDRRLIWYSYSHAFATTGEDLYTDVGEFGGLSFKENGVFERTYLTNLAAGATNYALVFINGCKTGATGDANTGANVQSWITKMNAKAYMGWDISINDAVARDFAKFFFEELKRRPDGSFRSIEQARLEAAKRFGATSPNKIAAETNLRIFGDSSLILDLIP